MITLVREIKKIETYESPPKVIKNLFDKAEIQSFLNLYEKLPITVFNKNQNVVKKRWLQGYDIELEKKFYQRIQKEIGEFKLDNLKTDDGKEIFGLIQESYAPIGLHVDSGFDLNTQIFKQILIPLTPVGSTIIFKNRYYKTSTNFTIDPKELKLENLKYGQNKRSSEHLNLYDQKPFDKKIHKEYLSHEKIENLSGLEIELIYEWELGSILVFDRSHLHASSSKIEGKKIGIASFLKK